MAFGLFGSYSPSDGKLPLRKDLPFLDQSSDELLRVLLIGQVVLLVAAILVAFLHLTPLPES